MSAPKALISNGTCYHGPNELSSENIIPCGNAALGAVFQCCQAGDFCLDDSFCWSEPYNTSYLAGCTSPPYRDPLCPPMGPSHQQLLPLVLCPNSSQSPSHAQELPWSACPDATTTRTALAAPIARCTCTDPADALLWADAALALIASLPVTAGGAISYAPGRVPPTSVSMTTLTASRDGHATTLIVPAVAPASGIPATFPPAAAAGLSTAARAGIGIGAAALGLAAMGMAFAGVAWRRRRERDDAEQARVSAGASVADTDADGEGVAAWGFKSELPAEGRHAQRVELPADEVVVCGETERQSEEAGPVSPVSVGGDVVVVEGLSSPPLRRAVPPQLLDSVDGVGELDVREVGERTSGERRYGEGTRLEAIPEAVTD